MQFGDLHVSFGRHTEREESKWTPPDYPSESKQIPINPDKEISDEQQKQFDREYLEVEELRTREERLAELFITDPLQAEELIRNEELEDVDTPSNDIED